MEEHTKLQHIYDWIIVTLATLFGTLFFTGGLYYLFVEKADWLISTLQQHFAAIVLTPLMMTGSIVVVLVLKMSQGPIHFKLLGVEFEGAAAPVIMWVFVYLTMVTSIKLLW